MNQPSGGLNLREFAFQLQKRRLKIAIRQVTDKVCKAKAYKCLDVKKGDFTNGGGIGFGVFIQIRINNRVKKVHAISVFTPFTQEGIIPEFQVLFLIKTLVADDKGKKCGAAQALPHHKPRLR